MVDPAAATNGLASAEAIRKALALIFDRAA
jgi:hypothetical protein